METKPNNYDFVNKNLMSLTGVSLVSTLFAGFAHADIDSGKAWLSMHNQSPDSSIANSLQTQQEVSQSLKLLQSPIPPTDITALLEKESSTEGLVRLSLLAYDQDKTINAIWQKLINNQNADGGFGHIEGWQSNPLDTAFVLIALSETDYLADLDTNSRQSWQARINKALIYLASQQQTDGAYRITHLDDLYTSSYVLSALTPYLKNQSQYIPTAQKLVSYLESKQTAPATWSDQLNNKGLFLDALIAESLYPYQDHSDIYTFRTNFENRALQLQNADGSWQDDAYVTALVLRSIYKQSLNIDNPTVSQLTFSVQDSETNALLSNVNVTLSSQSNNFSAKTNNEGLLSITDIPAGEYSISITQPGYVSMNVKVTLRVGTQGDLGILKLSRSDEGNTSFIRGVVTDSVNNAPIAGARIKVYYGTETLETTTNDTGSYQLSLPYSGKFTIEVFNADRKVSNGAGNLNLGQTYNFSPVVKPIDYKATTLFGKVIDEEGNPIGGAKIFINNIHLTTSLADGSYRINDYQVTKDYWTEYLDRNKPSGFEVKEILVLTAEYEGYRSINREVTLKENDLNDLSTLIMYALDPNDPNKIPPGMVHGQVNFKFIDKDTKEPINGVNLTYQKLNSKNEVFFTGSIYSPSSYKTALFTNGDWQFFLSKRNYKLSIPATFNIAPNSEQDITLELEKQGTGTLKIGIVTSTDNQPIYNTTILAEQLDSNGTVINTIRLKTDSENSDSTFDLTEGTWQITAEHEVYLSTKPQIIKIDKGSTTDIKIALGYPAYQLDFNLVDSLTESKISEANVKIYKGNTDTVLYEKVTNSDGAISLTGVTASSLRIEVISSDYLESKYYFDKQFTEKGDINLGEIRLRPKSAETVLPDLAITALDSSDLTTDQQRLTTAGTLKATIENKGNTDLLSTSVGITAFIDTNKNRTLDEGEQIVALLTEILNLNQGATTDIILDINGKLAFSDAPIAVMIDSESQIAERDEDNNVRVTSDGVEIKPPVGTLDVEEMWMYGYKASDADKPNNWSRFGSSASPVAAPLEDTNKDGIIGQGDISSVIYNNYFNQMVVLDGSTGEKKWSVAVSSQYTSPTVADIDNDGLPEIIVNNGSSIEVYSNTGNLKKTWSVGVSSDFYSNDILIADLNKDGDPEIIVGNSISNYSSGLITRGKSTVLAIADLDDDGIPELVTNAGSEKLELDTNNAITGTIQYFSYSSKIFASVADVTGDGKPNIVTTGDSHFTIFDSTGKQINRFYIPTGGRGGVPTLADFDGDGIADMGVAGAAAYTVMRNDGSIIWSSPTQDRSSNVTGSSIFDFNNDGNFEVVYADEDYFRIYDAQTGNIIYQTPNSSHTAHEAPIVVDADADGHADVLFISNISGGGRAGRTAGIRMISSKNKDWANTRNIWNQYSYHVTNINDDLSVPKNEPNSWEVHNTYRANLIPGVNATAASDLTTSYIQINDKGISAPSRFTARIGNAGGKAVVKGTPVSFYRLPKGADATQAELIGKVTLTDTLAGGDYVDLSIDYTSANGNLADFGELIVIANDAGAGIESATGIPNPTNPSDPVSDQGVIQEYTRSNNIARIAVTGEYTAFSLSGSVDKTAYNANDTVTITATPTNLGSFPTSPVVRVSIIDSAGNLIEQFSDSNVNLGVAIANIGNPPVNSTDVSKIWQTGQARVGNYTAHIELVYKDKVVSELDRNFAIVADGNISAQIDNQLYIDKADYATTDLVKIHSRLSNTASNAMAGQRDVSITVTDPSGKVIWTQAYSHDELAPNAIKDQYFTLPLSQAVAGNYTVTSTIAAPDGSQADEVLTQSFSVLSTAQTGFGIDGTLTNVSEVNAGDTVNWQWTVNNASNEKLSDLPLSIALFKNGASDPFETISLSSVNIDAAGTLSGITPWVSSGLDGEYVTAVLFSEFAQNKKGLAQSQVLITNPPIEVSIDDTVALDDTLLVYYSCAPGWHTNIQHFRSGVFNNECFDQRAAVLKRYLDRINVPYKLVKQPELFIHEMQSGKYAQYWLLGAVEKLHPNTQRELTELTYSGDNLLVDSGLKIWGNQNFYALAGATYQGTLSLNSDMLTLVDQFITPPDDLQVTNAPLNITNHVTASHPLVNNWTHWLAPIDPNKTQVWATVNGYPKRVGHWKRPNQQGTSQEYPSILSQKYGNGSPVAAGFDLINSLDLATAINLPPYPDSNSSANVQELHWDSLLTQLLTSRRQTVKVDYVPHEVVRLPVSLENTSNQYRNILVEIDLPANSQWLGYKGGVDDVAQTDSKINYQITVQAGQTIKDVLTIRLPENAGAHPIRVTVSDITAGSNKPTLLESFEARYMVRDIDSRIHILQNTIDQWAIDNKQGHLKLNTKNQIERIRKHHSKGLGRMAVYEAARLGDTLSLLQESNDAKALEQIRYEADELLRALQIDWYMYRDGYVPHVTRHR